MSAQTSYKFGSPIGAAGGLVDLAPYAIDTFLNSENTGVLKFGVGVVKGATPGTNVALPSGTSVAADFEGIVVNGRTTEYDVEGNLSIRKGASVGVMRYGRIYAKVVHGVSIAVNNPVYLVISGDNKGLFTNSSSSSIAVAGVFRSAPDSNDIAQIELFNAPAPAVDNDTVYALPAATDSVLGGVKVGTGLDVAEDGTISVHQG